MENGSIAGTAKYPEFILESKRLASFTDWPISLNQNPHHLSDAGFFYSGRGDRVICFSCGGHLSQWEVDDDVWEEHGFYFGQCKYMQLYKGSNFHDEMIERKARARLGTQNVYTSEKHQEISKIGEGEHDLIEKSNRCQICCANEYNTVFIPCGHVYACTKCASSLHQCPLCRKRIENVLRVFLPE